jgi:hypothetical protein
MPSRTTCNPSYQVEWVKAAADQYARTGDNNQAGRCWLPWEMRSRIIDSIRTQAEQAGDRDYEPALLNQTARHRPGRGRDSSNPALQKLTYVRASDPESPIVLVVLVLVIGAIRPHPVTRCTDECRHDHQELIPRRRVAKERRIGRSQPGRTGTPPCDGEVRQGARSGSGPGPAGAESPCHRAGSPSFMSGLHHGR